MVTYDVSEVTWWHTEVNLDFKNHYTVLLWIWNKYNPRLRLKILEWASVEEVFYRKETSGKDKWWTYKRLKMKSREQLTRAGINSQWFKYTKLGERFNIKKYH